VGAAQVDADPAGGGKAYNYIRAVQNGRQVGRKFVEVGFTCRIARLLRFVAYSAGSIDDTPKTIRNHLWQKMVTFHSGSDGVCQYGNLVTGKIENAESVVVRY